MIENIIFEETDFKHSEKKKNKKGKNNPQTKYSTKYLAQEA